MACCNNNSCAVCTPENRPDVDHSKTTWCPTCGCGNGTGKLCKNSKCLSIRLKKALKNIINYEPNKRDREPELEAYYELKNIARDALDE